VFCAVSPWASAEPLTALAPVAPVAPPLEVTALEASTAAPPAATFTDWLALMAIGDGVCEPPGTVIAFDDAGRTRGLADAARTSVADFDATIRTALDHLSRHASVAPGKLGAAGFCIGGHVAFRAALQPDVRATVCFYGTGIHNGKLGADADAGSLRRAASIRGSLLLVWGSLDPHVPAEGRDAIAAALTKSGVAFTQRTYAAEHAFMRDEGPRFDPAATDAAFAEMVEFFRATFAG